MIHAARLVLTEFSPEITDALATHAHTDEADALSTCLKRLAASPEAEMTQEAKLAFARLVGVPETVLDMTPVQARACFELVSALNQALDHGVSIYDASVFVIATRDDAAAKEETA